MVRPQRLLVKPTIRVGFYVVTGLLFCCMAVATACLVLDRRVFRGVDYSLLATFICFFVFVGNLRQIDSVSTFIFGVMAGRKGLVSALASQVISNVPAAAGARRPCGRCARRTCGRRAGPLTDFAPQTAVKTESSLFSLPFAARNPTRCRNRRETRCRWWREIRLAAVIGAKRPPLAPPAAWRPRPAARVPPPARRHGIAA